VVNLPASAAVIELAGVVKYFGRERVLNHLDLAVPAGAITVLIGPSGAGKTVTINHIVGLLRPTAGVIRVEGKDLASLSEEELFELRQDMGVVHQGSLPFSCGLFFSIDVYENVAFALRVRKPRWSPERVDRVTMTYLKMLGLAERARSMPAELSAGMCKRTALARALALEPPIVIIDDFDSGIDGVRLSLLCELLREAQLDTEATFLITTHNMKAARRIADYVAVLHEGRIVVSGEAESVLNSDDPFVRQLVTGDPSGPLELRTA
jgi:phospholipid/cholesterol/gamma-HCH transport system ATP-binding protein